MKKTTTLHPSSTTKSRTPRTQGEFLRYKPEKFNRIIMLRVSPVQEKMVNELVKSYGVSKSFVIRYGIESTYAENKVK